MTTTSDKEGSGNWTPERHIRTFQEVLEIYQKEHPNWRIEVLVSFIKRALIGLRDQIADHRNKDVTWNYPFTEFQYPVQWDWSVKDVKLSQLITGKITEQNTCDAKTAQKTLSEIMVGHLNTLALQDFTHHVWLEKRGEAYSVFLPAKLYSELQTAKTKSQRQEFLEEFSHPFSIGAASIDFGTAELQHGKRISKRGASQLAKIDKLIAKQIGFSCDINDHHMEMSLVFQVHPLTIDYERQTAFHRITVGLFIPPKMIEDSFITTTPSDWSQSDIEALWRELLKEVDRIVDHFLPKTESETSEILLINAEIEIRLVSSTLEEKNAVRKKVFEALSQTGLVREITVKSAKNNSTGQMELQPKEQQIPATFKEFLIKPILKSRFRWPIAIAVVSGGGLLAVYTILPGEVKLQIWNHLVNLFHSSHK